MSYDLQFLVIALSAVMALYCGVVALKRRLLRRPDAGVACAAGAACIMVATLITVAPGARYSTLEHARVEKIRRDITPALERYRDAHGQYPDALADAGIQTPHTRYGPLHYYGSRSERPTWYLLSFGDPKQHGFEADWDSRSGEWQVHEFRWDD